MKISSSAQVQLMGAVFIVFATAYFFPFEYWPKIMAATVVALFPVQAILWRLSHSRKAKDYLFCSSFLVVALVLQHYWRYADSVFYLAAMLVAAIVRYPIFLAIASSSFGLELLRKYYYRLESLEEVSFRYALFFIAGSVTYLLLREEKRQKDEIKRELDHLKYGIHQVAEPSESPVGVEDQISRTVDAALALDESIKHLMQLIHKVFKPDATMLWQFLADKKKLVARNSIGDSESLRQDFVFQLGEGPLGWAALNKKPFFKQGEGAGGVSYFPSRKKPVIRSLLAVPVLEKDRLEGILSVESTHVNYFASDAEQALTSFAAQIAEMIQLARVAKEREERAFEFQAFYHASKELASIIAFDEIIQKLHVLCAEIVPFDFSALAILHPEKDRYAIYEWKAGEANPETLKDLPNDGRTWISWFLTNREEPLILSDAQIRLQEMPLLVDKEDLSGLSTFLAVPMRHQNNCIGALLLASRQNAAFSSYQSRIISILCNQAAVSLENSAILEKMEELAITDGLTGLFNHRYFQEAFLRELERAERQQQNLSLLIMDIDHFKSFNDNFGHPAGDYVLKSLAQLLGANARKIDILARYGGEEFAALLPGIDVKNARKTAERWRKAVQRASIKWEGKSFAVTLSIGLSSYPTDGASKIELIEKADRALYFAKENGRNQVQHISDVDQ